MDPDTLKPSSMETDFTPIQVCQPRDSPYRYFMVLDTLIGDLFTVPISYGMDKYKIKGGHVTEALPKDNPHPLMVEALPKDNPRPHVTEALPKDNPSPYAWEKGPISNFPQNDSTWKKTTQTQSNEKKEKSIDPRPRVGKKRAD